MPQKMIETYRKEPNPTQGITSKPETLKTPVQMAPILPTLGNQALQRMLPKSDGKGWIAQSQPLLQRKEAAAATNDRNRIISIFKVAEAFYKAENYSDAAINYTKILQFDSLESEQRAQILYNVGQCQRNLKRYANAIAYYEEAVTIGAGAYQKKAEYFLKLCRAEMGIATSMGNAVIALDKTDAVDLFTAAQDAYESGQYKQALDLYVQVQQQYPEVTGLMYYNIGQCNRNLKRWATALYFYQRSLEYDIGEFANKSKKWIPHCQKYLGGLPES